MGRPAALCAALAGWLLASAATAQPAPSGLDLARALTDRIVRVTGRQAPGLPGVKGYGLVVGEETGPGQTKRLVIVVPNDVVREPDHPEIGFLPPLVGFSDATLRGIVATLEPHQLPPDRGNIAVLTVPRPAGYVPRPTTIAGFGNIVPGVPAWQVGNTADFEPIPVPARFAYQDQAGWLLFEGVETGAGTAGAALIGERGVFGLTMGASPNDPDVTRVVPLPYVALRLRAWGRGWDVPFDGETIATELQQRGARASAPLAASPITLSPISVVRMLPADAAARASWVPPGARISPWRLVGARLYGSPRRESAVVGILPAGRALPDELWRQGAYDITYKLDGGAWFLISTSGQDLGYVAGGDIVEVWPPLTTAGLAGGKIVREWTVSGGKTAVLRDVGTAYELETIATCQQARCDTVTLFSPAPPATGAIVPTYQMAPMAGNWHQGDAVSLRATVPRRLIETTGTILQACIANDTQCDPETIYPPGAR